MKIRAATLIASASLLAVGCSDSEKVSDTLPPLPPGVTVSNGFDELPEVNVAFEAAVDAGYGLIAADVIGISEPYGITVSAEAADCLDELSEDVDTFTEDGVLSEPVSACLPAATVDAFNAWAAADPLLADADDQSFSCADDELRARTASGNLKPADVKGIVEDCGVATDS